MLVLLPETGFDFIVKYPADSLLRALKRSTSDVKNLIDDFLDTLFNLGVDLQDDEQRQRSPLLYAHHEKGKHEGQEKIADVKVRLQFQPGTQYKSAHAAKIKLCKAIHSLEAREAAQPPCTLLSKVDVFGLEPAPYSEFSMFWDAEFFAQIINDQKVLESLTAQVATLRSKFVACMEGLCDWVCCNLVCLTQAVRCRLSPAKGVSCGDVLFRSLPNCPKVLKGLLEASGSLLINIWNWIFPPLTDAILECRSGVGCASVTMLEDLTEQMKVTAELAERAPDQQFVESAKDLYFASKKALQACTEATLRNKKLWSTFRVGLVPGAAEIAGFGVACATQKGIPAVIFGKICLAFSVVSLSIGVYRSYESAKYVDICKSFDECLVTTNRIMFSCSTITRKILLSQNEPAAVSAALSAGGHTADLKDEHVKWWQKFMGEVIRSAGDDPATTAFSAERHYSSYLKAQNALLTKALAQLREVLGES